MSYEIAYGAIPSDAIDRALRLIHTDLLVRGATADQLGGWLWGSNWFPHLVWHPDILQLVQHLPEAWQQGSLMCDPQILLQFPHKWLEPQPEIKMHLDREPSWATAYGRRYTHIVGVPLSQWHRENGGLLVPHPKVGVTSLHLNVGDAVCLSPDQPHSGGVNMTGAIRYGVYFRWVGEAA